MNNEYSYQMSYNQVFGYPTASYEQMYGPYAKNWGEAASCYPPVSCETPCGKHNMDYMFLLVLFILLVIISKAFF